MTIRVSVSEVIVVYSVFDRLKLQKFDAKSATADSCFSLIGPRQCSAALGGPATSTEDLRHQEALNKPGYICVSCSLNFSLAVANWRYH